MTHLRATGRRVIAPPRGLWILALALVAGLLPGRVSADVSEYRVTDAAGVYFGNARVFQRPGVIKADRIYRSIAEYTEILNKGLTDKDVRYHFLMKKASERFLEAVKSTARDLNLDLLAELGSVQAVKSGAPAPTERTDEVVARLR